MIWDWLDDGLNVMKIKIEIRKVAYILHILSATCCSLIYKTKMKDYIRWVKFLKKPKNLQDLGVHRTMTSNY